MIIMKFVPRLFIFICWTMMVLYMITIPFPEFKGDQITYYDKFVHAFMFGVFTWLYVFTAVAKTKSDIRLLILFSVLCGLLFAVICEYIQNFIPGRTASEMDFIGGMIGVFISVFISYGIFGKKT